MEKYIKQEIKLKNNNKIKTINIKRYSTISEIHIYLNNIKDIFLIFIFSLLLHIYI